MTQQRRPMWKPVEVAKRYGFPIPGLTGAGQRIAILSFGGGLNLRELEDDFKALGISSPPAVAVKTVDSNDIAAGRNASGSSETHLDVEIVGSICPQAEITVYRAANDFRAFCDGVKQAVNDGAAVVSLSWGAPEPMWSPDAMGAMERALDHAKDSGVTVCAASGDGGSSDYVDAKTGAPIAAPDGRAHVNYPASSPCVLACGGTQLMSDGTERVWNSSAIGGGATGGGVSERFEVPSWQIGVADQIKSANDGKAGRVVPDVAGLAASGDWEVRESNGTSVRATGGTSAATPLWAALITLVNQKRAAAGKRPLGFVNERLYRLARRNKLFHSITRGDNKTTPDYPGYRALAGFDACTGWGTPIASDLVDALARMGNAG